MKKFKNVKIKKIVLIFLLMLFISLAVLFIVKVNISTKNQSKPNDEAPIMESSEDNNSDSKIDSDKTSSVQKEEENKNNKDTSNNNKDKETTNTTDQNNTENNNKKDEETTDKPISNGEDNKKDEESINNPTNNNQNTPKDETTNNPTNNDQNNNQDKTDNAESSDNTSNLDANDNINNSNNNQNTSDDNKVETPPETPVIKEDKNDLKRKEIEKSYGIKILYGDEIGSYKPKRVTPVTLTDEAEVTNYLNRLNTEFAKYPIGFFNDFNKKGMPLTIYLIKSANGVFSGFTDYQFMNNIKITLATDFSFEYTLHHEIMHYIDCYLNIVMYPNTPYDEYEKLNPTNFSYGNANDNEIYNMATNPRGAYFISGYGSTYVSEDRAEVFKYMMARAYAPIGCFESGETLNKKARVISNQIKTYFPSVNGVAHWDRFIK